MPRIAEIFAVAIGFTPKHNWSAFEYRLTFRCNHKLWDGDGWDCKERKKEKIDDKCHGNYRKTYCTASLMYSQRSNGMIGTQQRPYWQSYNPGKSLNPDLAIVWPWLGRPNRRAQRLSPSEKQRYEQCPVEKKLHRNVLPLVPFFPCVHPIASHRFIFIQFATVH